MDVCESVGLHEDAGHLGQLLSEADSVLARGRRWSSGGDTGADACWIRSEGEMAGMETLWDLRRSRVASGGGVRSSPAPISGQHPAPISGQQRRALTSGQQVQLSSQAARMLRDPYTALQREIADDVVNLRLPRLNNARPTTNGALSDKVTGSSRVHLATLTLSERQRLETREVDSEALRAPRVRQYTPGASPTHTATPDLLPLTKQAVLMHPVNHRLAPPPAVQNSNPFAAPTTDPSVRPLHPLYTPAVTGMSATLSRAGQWRSSVERERSTAEGRGGVRQLLPISVLDVGGASGSRGPLKARAAAAAAADRVRAATLIQSVYRMHVCRRAYTAWLRASRAARLIGRAWASHAGLGAARRRLALVRAQRLHAYDLRAKRFAENWNKIKSGRRVVIHIPSLGYAEKLRRNLSDLDVRENRQMARLCDILDDKVDVIYVTPLALSDDTQLYYRRLLGLQTALGTGNPADQSEAKIAQRYTIVTPEAIERFAGRRMCLSTLLTHSPRALARIRSLIKGRPAYIVSGVPHADDVTLSHLLDVPVLGARHDLAQLYGTVSGARRIFLCANDKVSTPPGVCDVYSIQQLHESLARLVTNNLSVRRWLFKMDAGGVEGRGVAWVDVIPHLPCLTWAQREQRRYGDKWTKLWAQDAAYSRILGEIPRMLNDCAQPVDRRAYSSWTAYIQAFLSQGGAIEACPPADSMTSLTVGLLVEPDGPVSVLCSGDLMSSGRAPDPCPWGLSLPQASVPPALLAAASHAVGEACAVRGILGYIGVDFVTFIHPTTLQQELWAVDLHIGYPDCVALAQLTRFVTSGGLDNDFLDNGSLDNGSLDYGSLENGFLDNGSLGDSTASSMRSSLAGKRRKASQTMTRTDTTKKRCFAVVSTHLVHANLGLVRLSAFFQMCRLHGIGYDVKEKQGTVFTLLDGSRRESLSMLCVGDTLQSALSTFRESLAMILQQIPASPGGQRGTNSSLQTAIKDIDSIISMTEQNKSDSNVKMDAS